MASFRIHEDQENTASMLRKDNEENFLTNQRRALGDLSHFACNQNRNIKNVVPTNVPVKPQEEKKPLRPDNEDKKPLRPVHNDKNIVLPVAQFRAFSVYEDKPTEAEVKKREPTFKPFAAKDARKDNFFIAAAENVRTICNQKAADQMEKAKAALPRLPLQEKKDAVVESPMSFIHDSSVLSMSVSKNESQLLEDEDEEDATTAQTDREMFFHVVEYRQDIYEYMREIEKKHRANPRYMRKQPDITYHMRAVLVDWLAEVCEEYAQQSETLHLAVSYVDRFLSFMSVLRVKLQLVGTAATFIAAKYEEVYPPEVTEFVYITDDTYTKKEVLRMEHLILKVLSFDLSTPTSLAFLSHYCISNGVSKKTFHLASYIAELSLLEADPYLQFKPSIIAASSLAVARHCLLCRYCDEEAKTESEDKMPITECLSVAWPPSLARCSGYDVDDLKECMKELTRTHSNAAPQPHRAIPDKYKSNSKFDAVSLIEPRPMYPVPKYQPMATTVAKPEPSTDTRPRPGVRHSTPVPIPCPQTTQP